ncbi:hypothetical protein K440DRAFT_163376 [Wilcoxina mikolae CBS 423.85]|nr:hypothetical protein K440DRAFT_163376 [Wilcoxina mikolae CBS 423.85]
MCTNCTSRLPPSKPTCTFGVRFITTFARWISFKRRRRRRTTYFTSPNCLNELLSCPYHILVSSKLQRPEFTHSPNVRTPLSKTTDHSSAICGLGLGSKSLRNNSSTLPGDARPSTASSCCF